jgi:hypothetical protein
MYAVFIGSFLACVLSKFDINLVDTLQYRPNFRELQTSLRF